ncbi:PITH domain-containing protein GA19395 [Anopheles ziemanni]|uniref:PITH domain-containing protein GA19395 n=1 Tax=Anopheles coustani TaxID=139045 RepID=UPI00265A8BB0|nr:PITH domain-containing protein GA19395 [Anopheles coustani]XP_058166312.1 PITH domain-containing protein GA19395 [Anopheles ziemanni]
MPHGHSHSAGCGHEALGIENELEVGIQYSLYEKIDMNNLECLNEELEGSGKTVFKSYCDRLNREKFVRSDADEELLFNIPFTGNVKLKGVIIIGADDDTHPKKMRLFKNRPKMTFDDAAVIADQEFDLERDTHGVIEYSTKVVSFANVHHLSIHIPCNYGNDSTTVYYIGLKGEFSEAQHHGVTICTYESRPNVSDHKNSLFDSVNHQIQ